MGPARFRPAWAEVDAGAVAANARLFGRLVAPARLCAVVKADGYGHGALTAARAALRGGAVALAVALVEEGVALRQAGIADPIVVLAEPPSLEAAEEAAARGLEPTVASFEGLARVAEGAKAAGSKVAVHLKVDTGMHRLGADPKQAPALAEAVAAHGPALTLAAVWTHMAVADGAGEEDRSFTVAQLEAFEAVLRELRARGLDPPLVHAANSAAAILHPRSRHQAVRLGIGLYGVAPSKAAAEGLERLVPAQRLRAALSLKARVTAVRRLPAGARPSYGRLRPLPGPATVATIPLGYADGIPRALFGAGFEVLIGGRRRPLAGMVTMDQLVVDCGEDHIEVGDEVVLLGRQGAEEVSAEEWARRLKTISYEVLTGIGPRVPRVVVGEVAEEANEPDAHRRWLRRRREGRLR